MSELAVRVGVDIGGTFTDVVLEREGHQHSSKVLTTYTRPEDAIVTGLLDVCQQADVLPEAIDQIIHGTTLATNALIERRGAKTALITTAGFRDVIEMRTESRFDQYDLNLQVPTPLLPRNRRFVINERMSAQGQVLRALERHDVEQLAEDLNVAGFDSIAVGLIHAYANDSHERLIAEVLNERLPDVAVSLSSEVSPQMREYERFNTTVANAYIKPLMKSYLSRLRERLSAEGVRCPIFLMHSGGGIMSLESAADFPVRLVESGPAGGAIFAADVAARHGVKKALSFDMGGTTAKICLIRDYQPKTARSFEVAREHRFKKGSGMPISIPVIDMVEIGAGGGSLASVDALNRIRVGPESAASEPGPASYGLGGTRATVTDADLVLGKLDPDQFAGGSITLDTTKAERALSDSLGDTLGISDSDAAWALSEVVDETMANAARVHAVENGEDLSEYTMIAFGGAAPLHAARLCEKLGINTCLIPPGAGVGSAIGFLRAPFSFETNRTAFMRLNQFDADVVQQLFADMDRESSAFVRECGTEGSIQRRYRAYMRYAGQGWEIPIELSEDHIKSPQADTLQGLFEERYTQVFGRPVAGLPVEVTVWSVNAYTELPERERIAPLEARTASHTVGTRLMFNPQQGLRAPAALIKRNQLSPGQGASGPALLVEDETTIAIPAQCRFSMHADASIGITTDHVAADTTRNTASTVIQNSAVTGSASEEIAQQVMWNRLISIVEEQAQALIRTAFSTSVREAGDLSAGVYNAHGEMLAQAVTGTPGHVNAMADSVGHFMRRIGCHTMLQGDVYITNDPWEGTGHKHDITVVTPAFHADALVGFFACTAHVTDIGGRGFGADANDVHEEGFYIPIMKFIDQGKVDDTLVKLIRANVREPDQLIGDIYALATCNAMGDQRLAEMMREFGLADLKAISEFILNQSRAATVARIGALKPAAADGHMRIDGYSEPIDLKVRVCIESERIITDWSGTSGIDKKGINVPLVYTKAYACYALKCVIAPDVPNNAGSLAPFEIAAPVNSIVNALPPAPVALRHIIGHMVPDTVFDALDKLLPDTVPAEGAGCLCNFQVSIRPRTDAEPPPYATRAEVLTFNSGGSGARAGLDGMNTTAFPSGVMTIPVEATEHVGPVIIWRKELRPDSGGAGQYRGGLGQYMEVGASEGHEFDIQAMLDRIDHPARGRRGGHPGAPTRIERDDGVRLRGKGKQFIPHGVRVRMAFPGGAGFGDPEKRNAEAVKRDLALGYISEETALQHPELSRDDVAKVMVSAKTGDQF